MPKLVAKSISGSVFEQRNCHSCEQEWYMLPASACCCHQHIRLQTGTLDRPCKLQTSTVPQPCNEVTPWILVIVTARGGQSSRRSHLAWRCNNGPSTFSIISLSGRITFKLYKEIPSLRPLPWWAGPLLSFSFLAQQPRTRQSRVHCYQPPWKLEHLVLHLVASFQKISQAAAEHMCKGKALPVS